MKENDIKFFKFLNYLLENNFSDNNIKFVDTISSISSSSNSNEQFLIESNELLLNLDLITEDLFINYLKYKSKPTSMDGMYFTFKKDNFKLYLIEFKGEKLETISHKNYFKCKILSLFENECKNKDCPIKSLNKQKIQKMYETYDDEITSNLKLKPYETIFIILPKLYEEYRKKESLNDEEIIPNFLDYLISKISINLLVVYPENKPNLHNEVNSFKQSIKDKYKVYKGNIIKEYHIINKNTFIRNWEPIIEKGNINDLEIIIDILDKYKNIKEENLNEILINYNVSNEKKRKNFINIINKYR